VKELLQSAALIIFTLVFISKVSISCLVNMAKCQRTMRDMFRFGIGEFMEMQVSSPPASSSTSPPPNKKVKMIQKANEE
jgi:hypothetical protein